MKIGENVYSWNFQTTSRFYEFWSLRNRSMECLSIHQCKTINLQTLSIFTFLFRIHIQVYTYNNVQAKFNYKLPMKFPSIQCCVNGLLVICVELSYTYSEYPLDTGYFFLWRLSIMLRYYQFKKEYTLYPPWFFSQSNYILQHHWTITLLHS